MSTRLLRIVTLAVVVGLTGAYLHAVAAEKGKKEAELPADAKGFAGMIAGKVTATRGITVTVEVTKIDKVWKHSQAKNAESLVGQKVAVVAPKKGTHPNIIRFLKNLKVDEQIVLDVADKTGNSLTLLELTKEQRERIEKGSK
jgi:hypothetical protein